MRTVRRALKLLAFVPLVCSTMLSGCGFEQQDADGKIQGYSRAYAAVSAIDSYGQAVGSAIADKDGLFVIDVTKLKPQVVEVVAVGGEYYPLGEEFPSRLTEDFTTRAMINYINGGENLTRVDAITTLAAGLAEYFVTSGMSKDEAVVSAGETIEEWLGVQPDYVDVAYPLNAGSAIRDFSAAQVETVAGMVELDSSSRLTILDGALALLAARINEDSGLNADEALAPHDLVNAFYDDIRYDGLLNGVAAGREITAAGLLLDEHYSRHEFALAIGRVLQSDYNYTKITSADAIGWITGINEFGPDLFSDNETTLIPEDRPYIILNGLEESSASGIQTLNYRVFDFNGIQSLTMYVDDEEFSLALTSNSFSIDTSYYKNEIYNVRMVALSIDGGVSEAAREVLFANSIESDFEMRPDGALVSGSREFAAVFDETYGIAEVEFYIDGIEVCSTTDIQSVIVCEIDTSSVLSSDGEHTFRVNVISNSGNVSYKSVSFVTDNTGPVLDWPLANDTLLDTLHRFTATVTEDQAIGSVRFLYDGTELKSFEDAAGEETYNVDMTIDTRTVYEGSHTMTLEAASQAGVVTQAQRSVYVDWSSPSVNIITASGTKLLKGKTLNVTFQALDSNGIAGIRYYVDGTLIGNLSPSATSFTLSNSAGESKDAVVKVEVEDLAGRVASDSILVQYQVLSMGSASLQMADSSTGKLTFVVNGVQSDLYTVVLSIPDAAQSGRIGELQIAQSYNPALKVGFVNVTFPAKEYSSGCGKNWRLLRYSVMVKYQGVDSNIVTGVSSANGTKAYFETPPTGCSSPTDNVSPLE